MICGVVIRRGFAGGWIVRSRLVLVVILDDRDCVGHRVSRKGILLIMLVNEETKRRNQEEKLISIPQGEDCQNDKARADLLASQADQPGRWCENEL